MHRILELGLEIRCKVNSCHLYEEYFKRYLDEWSALCVAMDTLEDTCCALGCYESNGLGMDIGEKYLRLYGFMQAVFLQQDSINKMYQLLVKSNLINEKNSPWSRIRALRNLTVGHPVEKNDKGEIKRCFISQATISNSGFQLLVWNRRKGDIDFEDVDLNSLYEEYKSEAIIHLNVILQAIK
jgi:hypothetical protein